MTDDLSVVVDSACQETLQEVFVWRREIKIIRLNHGVGRYVMRGGNIGSDFIAMSEQKEQRGPAKEEEASNSVHGPGASGYSA